MVVLAASICTRGGKALLSRQFRDVSKERITSLLANFPSLVSEAGTQHTTIEDEHVRYVYQPLEEFYIVLITNKHSNILQDIDTLHLFGSIISEILRIVDEREIFDNAFVIINAFDEVVNLGYKENLSLTQVENYLEMDSHEEKIQEIIERNKELEATEERKRRAKEIQRKELARRNLDNASFGGMGAMGGPTMAPAPATYQSAPSVSSVPSLADETPSGPKLSNKPLSAKGGLQLGKKTTKAGPQSQPLLSQVQPSFSHLAQQNQSQVFSLHASSQGSPVPQKVPNENILVTINETVTAELTREGTIVMSKIRGDLELRINKKEYAYLKLLLKTADKGSPVQYKTHPNVDRNLFTQNSIIGLKDKTKPFPANDHGLKVLRWQAVGGADEDSYLPLILTAWVTSNEGMCDVTLEYEVSSKYIESRSTESSIDNVKILVPIPTYDITLKDAANVSYEVTEDGVVLTLEKIPFDEPLGSFEFSIASPDEDSLFPISVQLDLNNKNVTESDISLGKVLVIDVVSNTEDEKSLPFGFHSNLNTELYQLN